MRLAVALALGACCLAAEAETKVEKLADNLFRVRVKTEKGWPESGLSRYGILKELPVLGTQEGLDFGKISPVLEKTGPRGFKVKFPLAEGECVYGLGDVSRAGVQRRPGKYEFYVENVNSYIPIPMAWTTRGWGVFFNTTWTTRFDIGASDPDAMVVTAEEGGLDFYVFTGKDAAELIDAYTRVTGRPSMLPIWGYGFTFVAHQWIDQFALVDEVNAFRDRQIPCDVMGLEPGWMEKFYDATTHKRWDPTRFHFPFWRPVGSLTFPGAMERVGMKLSLWLCCKYDLFRYEEECIAGKDTLRRRKALLNGHVENDTWVDEHIKGGDAAKVIAKPDESRMVTAFAGDPHPYQFEEGTRPWFEHLQQFVDQGAQAFKLDGAWQVSEENGVPGRTWSNGMADGEAHNLYPIVYDKQMATGYERYTGKRAMVYSAGGYAGVQQYVATWAGDTGGGVKPLISVLNLGLTGHPHQSCDMEVRSGFPQGLHFGFLMPWAQQNNWDYWDLPWMNPEEKVRTFRSYCELRYRLMPYLYSTAAHASETGYPIARALPLVYPDVAAYSNCTNTYMLGDNLLVGVYSDEVEIPSGTWYEWRTDAKVVGPATLPVRTTPDWGGALYVKAGAILPTWPVKQHLEKGWNEEVIFEVWPTAKGSFTLHEDDGVSLAYREGRFARTELTVEPMTNGLARFTVGRRTGAFDGMPATRRMKVRFHLASRIVERDLGDVGEAGATVMCPKDIEDPVCADVPANEPGWKDRTVLVLGDSITDPNLRDRWKNYWAYLPELLGVKPLVYGRNGDQWHEVLKQAKKAKAELGDAPDAILIFAGTNDFALDVPMGKWYDVAETEVNRWGKLVKLPRRSINRDLKTFRGRVNAVLEYLRNEFPDAQVVVMTPTHRDFFTCGGDNIQPDESYPNAHGLYLEDYVAAIREGARIWSAPVIDLHAEAGLCPRIENQGRLFWDAKSDRLHPSSEGHRRLALLIAAKLRTLPATFKTGK